MTVMTTEKPATEHVDFGKVQIGDVLTFLTADNGYGGSGGSVSRTGVVTGKTDKTVTLRVTAGRVTGSRSMEQNTARLLRRDWSARSPRRVSQSV